MSFFRDKTILVLAPHVDDEIHCAGTLARAMQEQVAEIHIIVGSLCRILTGLEELKHSCRILEATHVIPKKWPVREFDQHRQEILDLFVSFNHDYKPDIVFCPSSADTHQDHSVFRDEAVRAFRDTTLLGWEYPNNQRQSCTNFFVPLSDKNLDTKLSVWKCYKSQRFRKYFDESLIKALAIVRGKQCRCPSGLAEAFETISVTV